MGKIRRLSLPPKSILKQKSKDDDTTSEAQNVTMSQIQFPTHGFDKDATLEGNNTTSRISASLIKGNRRVSFAPDVTLHKFDFVPQSVQNVREPRRKSSLKVEISVPEAAIEEKTDADNSGETMTFTNPIGSIFQQSASPEVPAKEDGYQPVFDKEISMDITQLFAKHSAKPNSEDALEEIGLTEDALNNQHNEKTVPPQDESMELTAPIKNNPGVDEESMDITDRVQVDNVDQDKVAEEERISHRPNTVVEKGETMEFTNIQMALPLDMPSSQVVASTQLEPLLPSKRRKLSNGSYQSPVKAQMPHSPDGKENDDTELTDMERLSPIPLVTQSMNQSQKSEADVANIKNDINTSMSTAHMEPISLQTFFSTAGVQFDVDRKLKELKLNFPITAEIDSVNSGSLYKALYCLIPILEIQAFTSKELNRRIVQSKSLLQGLQEQIASNSPPRLIQEYFLAQNNAKEEANKKLSLVASVSRLQSEKVWYEWRSQHLKGIKTVLEENMSILLDENAQIMKYMNEINDVGIRVTDIKQVLIKELDILKQHGNVLTDNKRKVSTLLRVKKLKEDLKQSMLQVTDLTDLEIKKEKLVKAIENTKLNINQITGQIQELQNNLRQSKVCTEYDVKKLKDTHQVLENISGIRFKGLKGSELLVSLYNEKVTASIDLSKFDDASCVTFKTAAHGIAESEKDFINCWITNCQKEFQNGILSVCTLQKQLRDLSPVLSEFERLRLAFSTKIELSPKTVKNIVFQTLDPKHECKISLSIRMDQFIDVLCSPHSSAQIRAFVIYGEDKTARRMMPAFIRKYKDVFSWLSRCNVDFKT